MNHVDNPFINPRILSYCPGILGLERGLKRAIGAIRTVAYVEIEAFIVENLLAGMEAGLVDAAPIWCNLKTFDAVPFRGRVDGIIGGYPCQPFSNAGGRKGAEDARHLYPYLEQHIGTIGPVWCFFENVSGHISLGFAEVRESLSNMGYAVEAGIFTAEEVGAPHERERLFILAIRRDWLAYAIGAGFAQIRLNGIEINENDIGIVGASNQMAHANGSEWRPPASGITDDTTGQISLQREGTKAASGLGQCSETLANPNIHAAGRQSGSLSSQGGEIEGAAQRENRQRCGDEPRNSNEGLADSNDAGCEKQWLSFAAGQKQPAAEYLCADRWPARPGQEQFDWEASRIESRLGFSIDGYNYREDLLRAAGNSVVEQTAELAFRELCKKHFSK